MLSNFGFNSRVPNQEYRTSTQNPAVSHSGHPDNPSMSEPLFNPEAPVSSPSYPTITNDGVVTRTGIPVAYAGRTVGAFPVAPTTEAAIAYANRMNAEIQPSVQKFLNSPLFSAVQKKGIQEYYLKHSMPIGMAHQLEDLIGYRFEFILDDDKNTVPHKFESMKREICKRIELLRHVPNAGIVIRTASNPDRPAMEVLVDEDNSTRVLSNIESFLRFARLASHKTPPFQQVYEEAVDNAVKTQAQTVLYVFSARDLAEGRRIQTKEAQHLAKNLTKAVVNRPEDMVPTAFYPDSGKNASNEIINKLDTIAKKVGVIRPFDVESREVKDHQSEIFPFNEGCYIQASLLCPVNRFWDEIDEGRIFSKTELENHLGTPLTEQQYNAYFNKVLALQAEMFMKKDAGPEAKGNSEQEEERHFPRMHNIEFVTSTDSTSINGVPSLVKRLEEFRRHPDWTEEVERGINNLCRDNRIPIGMGLHMIQVVGRHHEFIIDNSGSMTLLADPEKPRGESRMDELKSRLRQAIKFLSYLPTKGVTISCLNDRQGDENHPHVIFPAANERDREQLLNKLNRFLPTIEPGGLTPLNGAVKKAYARANSRDEITNTIIFTDGEPSDNSPGFEESTPRGSTDHRLPRIVGQRPVREFIKLLANRDAQKIPLTIAQTTNDRDAIAWTNLCDNVCKNVNAIDDMANEIREVRSQHGKNFPYDENIYVMALLLGNDNALFDGLDEGGIFSKVALETLYGHPMSDEEYNAYYDEAYALQCTPGTESQDESRKRKASSEGFLDSLRRKFFRWDAGEGSGSNR